VRLSACVRFHFSSLENRIGCHAIVHRVVGPRARRHASHCRRRHERASRVHARLDPSRVAARPDAPAGLRACSKVLAAAARRRPALHPDVQMRHRCTARIRLWLSFFLLMKCHVRSANVSSHRRWLQKYSFSQVKPGIPYLLKLFFTSVDLVGPACRNISLKTQFRLWSAECRVDVWRCSV
jgi:hypothetical protein